MGIGIEESSMSQARPRASTRVRVLRPATRDAGAAAAAATSRHLGIHNRVVLARLGPVTLVNFGLLAAIGGAAAAWISLARQEQAGMRPETYAALLFVVLPVLAVIGSRLFSLALDWRELLVSPWAAVFKPGFAFQGGLVGAAVGVVGVAAYAKLDLFMLMDTMALGFPLGHAIGRLACHTYGCCHGRPTRSRLAIRYTNPDSKAVRCSRMAGIPLHPTQLYSAAGSLALFVMLAILASGRIRAGEIAAAFLILGSSGRFFVEFIRGEPTARLLRLTPFQWFSIGSFSSGLMLLYFAYGHPLHERFTDTASFLASLGNTAWSIYPFLVFSVIFLSFGVHGRRVGSFSLRASHIPRAPH
ncbi:MAG: prolipoprotein diacylglyceryl transferase [Deltaproteobacteria bacterium]|nr:prolipoprotein diacylglyceryl transferase [Deltaproteobacteria bacterium]